MKIFWRRISMPVIHVYLWSGRDLKFKEKVIEKVTKAFEELNIPAEAVTIIIHEIPKENWGIAGKPASEKFP